MALCVAYLKQGRRNILVFETRPLSFPLPPLFEEILDLSQLLELLDVRHALEWALSTRHLFLQRLDEIVQLLPPIVEAVRTCQRRSLPACIRTCLSHQSMHGLRPNLSWETNERKQTKRGCALFHRNKQSHLLTKISLRPPENKCSPHWNCNLKDIFSTAYHTCNCVAQLNLQLRLFRSFVSQLRFGLSCSRSKCGRC